VMIQAAHAAICILENIPDIGALDTYF